MIYKTVHKAKFTLANLAVAIEGMPACIDRASGADQGKAVPASASAALIPIGRFTESKTGDGTALVEIELFNPKRVHLFANSGTSPVDLGDILGPAYFTGANEVGVPADPSTYSLAGRVWLVETGRVGIETADAIGLEGPQGEQGEPGTPG